MSDYELLLHGQHKPDKYKDFHRYRLSAFYYLTVLVIVIFLVTNFLNYNPIVSTTLPAGVKGTDVFKPSQNVIVQQKSEELPLTTTPAPPSTPYKYEDLPLCDLDKEVVNKAVNPATAVLEFFRCASMILMRFARNPEGMLFNWPYTIYVCDEEDEIAKIPVKSFDNGEKQYWAILPKCQEPSTFVTLGTGSNNKAETELKNSWKNLTTIGTDPYLTENQNYDTFYHSVVSNSSENYDLVVDDGEKSNHHNVSSLDQVAFFNETITTKKIDMLWINPTAGNFEYWKYLNVNGTFDQMGITVCQLNIEVRKKDAEHWEKLITPLVSERRFIFMRPMATKGGNVTRTFFVNAQDPQCTRKYLE